MAAGQEAVQQGAREHGLRARCGGPSPAALTPARRGARREMSLLLAWPRFAHL